MTGGDDPVILDIDASLMEIHSENKDGTAANGSKVGSGSIRCSVSPTPPARRSPPDYDQATRQPSTPPTTSKCWTTPSPSFPPIVAGGHCVDDDLGEVRRRVMVRSDSAGCTDGFMDGFRSRNDRLRPWWPAEKSLFQRLWP